MSRPSGDTGPLELPKRLGLKDVVLWALANSVAGLGIGCAIRLFASGDAASRALVPISIVFANVVGFAAILAVRFVLPRYSGFPAYIRIPMAVVTLVAGGTFGSALAILVNPLVVFYQSKHALMVIVVNGVMALVVGFVTYTYERMRSQIEREASARGKLEQEMNIARDIQMELLPKSFPKIAGIDMFGFTVPARQVGGDCYDVIDLGDGKLGITIGDVSGKGTPAAILMANLQAAVRALSESGVGPTMLVERVNRLVYGYTEESVFITFFYCVFDTRTGEIEYVNAGHNPPCVLREDGSKEYLRQGGLVIGIVPDANYEQGKARLTPGDDLVLYTDGITEAANPNGEMFGEERLEDLLVKHRRDSARDIEERVYSGLRDFTAGASQADDLTMVVVKVEAGAPIDEETHLRSESSEKAEGGSIAARGATATNALRGSASARLRN